MPKPTETAQVLVASDGEIYLNGRMVSGDDLKREFERLGKINGGVFFVDNSSSDFSGNKPKLLRKILLVLIYL